MATSYETRRRDVLWKLMERILDGYTMDAHPSTHRTLWNPIEPNGNSMDFRGKFHEFSHFDTWCERLTGFLCNYDTKSTMKTTDRFAIQSTVIILTKYETHLSRVL